MVAPIPTLDGIKENLAEVTGIQFHYLTAGDGDEAVVFIHGNCASATFWEQTMLDLPDRYRGIAPDLRGFGITTPAPPIDGTKGLGDMATDVAVLLDHCKVDRFHLVGHSMGGAVAMKLLLTAAPRIKSLTLVATASPYGFGGSKDANGTPTYDDGAGAGGGSANPDFVHYLKEGERGDSDPMMPRNVMRNFYFKPPFIPDREDALLSSVLHTRIGDDFYPGDKVDSDNWPGFAPGKHGVLNALSRRYFDASAIVEVDPKPPVAWIRGADDLIISDESAFDVAALGAAGAIPHYPGLEACPPQPMLAQIRDVLSRYMGKGGKAKEVVFDECGHTPFIERPDAFNDAFHSHLRENS